MVNRIIKQAFSKSYLGYFNGKFCLFCSNWGKLLKIPTEYDFSNRMWINQISEDIMSAQLA